MVPSGRVQRLSLLRITSGVSRSFQLTIKVRAAMAAKAGRASGSKMRQKKPNELQPSIYEASCSSIGIEVKNPRKIKILAEIAIAIWTKITACRVSIKCSRRSE